MLFSVSVNKENTGKRWLTIESSSIVRPSGAVGKANVQNPSDFLTALFLVNKRTFRLKIGHTNREMIEFNRPN